MANRSLSLLILTSSSLQILTNKPNSFQASPQFQQQLEAFSEALQSGQLNLSAFGIPHNALTVADFLRSIESISSQEEDNKDGSAEKNKKVKR